MLFIIQKIKVSDDTWEKIESGQNKYIFIPIDNAVKSGECSFTSIDNESYIVKSYCTRCDNGDWNYNCGREYNSLDDDKPVDDAKAWRSQDTRNDKKCGDDAMYTGIEPRKVFGTKHVTLIGANTVPDGAIKTPSLGKDKDFLVYEIK